MDAVFIQSRLMLEDKNLPSREQYLSVPHLGELRGHDLGLDPAPELLVAHC